MYLHAGALQDLLPRSIDIQERMLPLIGKQTIDGTAHGQCQAVTQAGPPIRSVEQLGRQARDRQGQMQTQSGGSCVGIGLNMIHEQLKRVWLGESVSWALGQFGIRFVAAAVEAVEQVG